MKNVKKLEYGSMTKKRKIIVTTVTLAIALVSLCLLWMSPALQKQYQNMRAGQFLNIFWNNAVAAQNRSKFSISGTIVDDEGQPVDRVTVYITQGYLKDFGVSSEYVSTTQVVGHLFKFNFEGGVGISLSFHKDGYYDVNNVQFSLKQTKSIVTPYSSEPVVVTNQKIILERKGTLAKVERFDTALYIEGEKFTSFSVPEVKRSKADANSYSMLKSLPAGNIYLDVGRDQEGQVIKVIDNITKRLGPRTVSLNMTGDETNDGFILITDPHIRKLINIKEAPEVGYNTKQLRFSLPEYKNKTYFFYYKFGIHYGKGRLIDLGCDANGLVIGSIELVQNTEESTDSKVRRNLRTDN